MSGGRVVGVFGGREYVKVQTGRGFDSEIPSDVEKGETQVVRIGPRPRVIHETRTPASLLTTSGVVFQNTRVEFRPLYLRE